MKNITTFLVTTALAVTLIGCGEPATRTGAPSEPVVLRPATGGGPAVGNDVMDLLAAATATGNVQVANAEDADQVTPGSDRTLELLANGAADIGVVRSGQLVTAGAASLAALQAPLVVSNNEQAAAIAADPIAETAMADLSKIGLVGLALGARWTSSPVRLRSHAVGAGLGVPRCDDQHARRRRWSGSDHGCPRRDRRSQHRCRTQGESRGGRPEGHRGIAPTVRSRRPSGCGHDERHPVLQVRCHRRPQGVVVHAVGAAAGRVGGSGCAGSGVGARRPGNGGERLR